MKVIKRYDEYNQRRYSTPWVAIIDPNTAKPDFSQKVGGYTGRYGTGDAGDLYVYAPVEGAVYMYGQKDRRGHNSTYGYVQYRGGKWVAVPATGLIAALQGQFQTE